MQATADLVDLRTLSDRLRLSMIELHRLAGAGHLGSSLSIAEILAVLFNRHFRWPEADAPPWHGDRFVLSKGHAALGLYCQLAMSGRITPAQLVTFGRNGSALEPHPNECVEPSIHASTGSLGQGLSMGVGLALGSRLRGLADRTFVVIGDGELNEGQTWEAARCAASLALTNLIVIVDDNGMQQDGPTTAIMPVGDAFASWQAMGWHCLQCDGHDCTELTESISALEATPVSAPRMLWARSIKGRGVDFLEGRTESHFPPPLSPEEIALVRYAISRGDAR